MHELRNLRIAFVAGTLGQGGAEQQLFYILRTLRTAGANVHLLSLTQGEFWESRLREIGVDICFVGQRSSRVARLKRIVAELRLMRPQLVQSQHFYTNLYAVAAARFLRVPEIAAIRNDAVSEVKANGRILGTMSLKMPRVIAANSRLGVSNAVSLGAKPKNVRFLPNVVDTEHFVPQNGIARDEFRLLVVGRLAQQKRVDRFLKALALVSVRNDVKVRATIVGEGPLRAALEAQALALGLTAPAVEFVGAQSNMRNIYQNADVLVLTSQWEGTPNVIMEAMASGLPVVSTRVGGVSDLVEAGKTGVLITGSNDDAIVAALCVALQRLIDDAKWRRSLADAGREFIVERHGLSALPRFLSELYESVLT